MIENKNKADITMCWLQETHFSLKNIHGLKVKGCKEIFHTMEAKKKKKMGQLYLDQIDFKPKVSVTRYLFSYCQVT